MLDEASRQRLQKHLQKLTNATQLSFAERALLQEHNRFLAEIKNEAKPRRSTKSGILGTARVMSYEDLEKAREERAAKEAEKEAKKAEKEAKKAAKEAEQAASGKSRRGRKRKSPPEGDAAQPKAKTARVSDTQVADTAALEPMAPQAQMREPSQTPVAQMK